ncbi:hypothetical protein HS041_36580 [Planomonospora sp. ID67723]|uniref:hypothetical protein n=1 Tax=Planomonospora sp. ID67723 TaxID=2738134 RepID=UPI0018C38632|nr:hypothetical protein [Planomonospora sp. ID67723]MBG0833222.1 hypothetical protein [Planomonospora sp. ID67723]
MRNKLSPAERAESATDRDAGDLSPELLSSPVWTEEQLTRAGIPIVDAPFVSIGGGMGSFAMVDLLRISGFPLESVKVLTTLDYPWENYEYLTGVAQLPPGYRIRSDSASCPDNIWGFPSYAVRAAFSARSLDGFIAPFWNVFTENLLTDYWTPLAGQVFESLNREADRIGYWQTIAKGQARMVRRRADGGYFSILTVTEGGVRRVAYRSSFVHLAVGYPSVRFLPDLQSYRQKYGDAYRFVNSYEPHEHVYDDLVKQPGTVLVRGGGITASAILHRLLNDRERLGAQTRIVHLLRTHVDSSHGPSIFMRRRGGDGWAYQGFNWPKSSWGGQLKVRMEKLDDEERLQLWKTLKGSTTPYRKGWQKQLRRGRAEGSYHTMAGQIDHVEPGPDGSLTAFVWQNGSGGATRLDVNFIIDATGLVGDIKEHRVLADLLDHSGAERNGLGKLQVSRTFEVTGARNGGGRLYAAGVTTEGSYYAPVDSLLGLQYAALTICDDLARQGFCRPIGPIRSVAQWWKWMRNVAP